MRTHKDINALVDELKQSIEGKQFNEYINYIDGLVTDYIESVKHDSSHIKLKSDHLERKMLDFEYALADLYLTVKKEDEVIRGGVDGVR